ncbi:MAG: VPGUxxT family thioredoxin-like (seleno)protein, type 2 [Verrucomicrobiota bacterium]
MRNLPRSWILGITLASVAMSSCGKDIEVGEVNWGRDLDAAYATSAKSGKPVLILFQEVPGCAGCREFGRDVLSHPQVVEAIETEFEPILVYNNQPGPDAEILKRFNEPAWNFQVIRFLDSSGEDVIPRQDRVWTVEAVAKRMADALEAVDRQVPPYLRALAGVAAAGDPAQAAFAMFCFWTGERKLGALEGVLHTEAGWLEGREVTLVTYDRAILGFEELVRSAASFDCADKVFASEASERKMASRSRLSVGKLSGYRAARASDQKKQLSGTAYPRLNLSPVQATKLNAFARTDPAKAQQWLSPRQLKILTQS